MYETSSLADPTISLDDTKVVVSDLDNTLIDFLPAHQAAIQALAGRVDQQFADAVNEIYSFLRKGKDRQNLATWDKKSLFGTLRYSREAWIILAAKQQTVEISKTDVEQLRNLYWVTLGNNSNPYPDAKEFLKELNLRKIPLILMTASDSVMKVKEDLQLEYNPEFSREYKQTRIGLLPFEYKTCVIGDPIDKPDKRFFDQVVEQINKLGSFSKSQVLFIGDSWKSDLEVPEEMGYKTLLLNRQQFVLG